MNGVFKCLVGVALALCSVVGSASAETVTGLARLVDGDTLTIGDRRIRLLDIDAPESGQTCLDAQGQQYACGQRALDALSSLIGGRPVSCHGWENGRYGRLLAICTAGETELNRTMVAQGWAVPYRGAERYLAEALDAAKAARGLHAGVFQNPYAERDQQWAAAAQVSPNGCPIKGNIGKDKIYHMPWSRAYRRTRIDPSKGERWFCSEAEALAAGWRAPNS